MGDSKQQKSTRNIYAIYYWFFAGLLILVLMGFTISPQRREVPRELRGVWKASNPDYSDRTIEISPITLTFGTGGGTSTTGFIRHIDFQAAGEESQYTFTYASDEGTQTLSLRYDSVKQTLHLKNQPSIDWKRETANE